MAYLLSTAAPGSIAEGELVVDTGFPADLGEAPLDFSSEVFEDQFDAHYGLLAPAQTVLVRAYTDDSDDQILSEIQPRFIVMFEPNMEFIRRIEVRYLRRRKSSLI